MFGVEIIVTRTYRNGDYWYQWSFTVLTWSPHLQLLRKNYHDNNTVTTIEFVQKQLEAK